MGGERREKGKKEQTGHSKSKSVMLPFHTKWDWYRADCKSATDPLACAVQGLQGDGEVADNQKRKKRTDAPAEGAGGKAFPVSNTLDWTTNKSVHPRARLPVRPRPALTLLSVSLPC